MTNLKLRKVMKKRGWKIMYVPSGKGNMVRFIKHKLPYSSIISEFELETILQEY